MAIPDCFEPRWVPFRVFGPPGDAEGFAEAHSEWFGRSRAGDGTINAKFASSCSSAALRADQDLSCKGWEGMTEEVFEAATKTLDKVGSAPLFPVVKATGPPGFAAVGGERRIEGEAEGCIKGGGRRY